MKRWKQLTLEERKTISSGISHNYLVKDLGTLLSKDPTSISKEVKRNRILYIDNKAHTICKKLNRWPYVCNNCPKKYTKCGYNKYKYDAKIADKNAKANLINSRKGLDINEDNFNKIDSIIKNGVDNNKSIYQICIENKEELNKSVTTVYRYINKGYLTTKRMDLPFAVKYKKRKSQKKYEYSNNKIDRTNHTYIDYLSYLKMNPRCNVWQLDFLGSIKSDSNSILTFIEENLHFTLLNIIENPNSSKVVDFFDELENKIGIDNFKEIFQVILTDRDPCFNDIIGICFSKITGEERCKIFFCDPYVSNQKPHVENMNKQLRKFFPKKKSIDNIQKDKIKEINIILNSTPVKILDGFTPNDAFINTYGEDLYNNLFR